MSPKKPRLLTAPLIVNWSLSYRCNFDCSHCYTRGDESLELDTGQALEAGRLGGEWKVLGHHPFVSRLHHPFPRLPPSVPRDPVSFVFGGSLYGKNRETV